MCAYTTIEAKDVQGQRPNIILSRLLTSLMFTGLPNNFPQLTMAKLTLTLNSLLSFIRPFGLFMENCFTHFFKSGYGG